MADHSAALNASRDAYDTNAFFNAGFDPDVSVFGSLGFVAANVVLALLIETGLGWVERVVEHHPTYFRLLTKMYQELMVGGFTAFVSKRIQQWNVLSPDNGSMVSASDDMVLYYGLSIALQSMIMFWRLRAHNVQVDKLSIMTSAELYRELTQQSSDGEMASMGPTASTSTADIIPIQADTDVSMAKMPPIFQSVVKMKIIRRYFLNAYRLPELFSFPKYLRAIQDSEIIQLFDIEFFAWLLIVGVYAAFFSVCHAFDLVPLAPADVSYDDAVRVLRTRLITMLCFIAALGLAMFLLSYYLKLCVHKIVVQASNSAAEDHHLVATLARIAQEEAQLSRDETTEDAIERMNAVASILSDRPDKSTIWALLQTVGRKCVGKAHKHDATFQVAPIHLPFFSRKFAHIMIKLMLNMNAMYLALILQCLMTAIRPSIANPSLVWYPCVLVGLLAALGVNMAMIAPRVVGRMALVNATVRVNSAELKRSVEHFTEVAELQEKMITALLKHTLTHGKSLADMEEELKMHDPKNTGLVEIDVLRHAIKRYGFKFTPNKFNTFVRLQFKTKGTKVKYETFFKGLFHTVEKKDAALRSTSLEPSLGPLNAPAQPSLGPRDVVQNVSFHEDATGTTVATMSTETTSL